ncbi:hypothetical protein [Sediminitomix flava]|uniref:Uncharacterized protein n=1 Tax=Sediminitomix flava TaxID=379075 RepID=A0A315ZFF5_SEDFL|nr:hypothetical protein [Sediminitomix flava]PWJ43889.1 hypothetical protein BC781_101239 [Sediminitomix flava]
MKILSILFIPLFLFSCNSQDEVVQKAEVVEDITPEVLESDSYFTVKSEFRGNDIVKRIYDEAVEKDVKLRSLQESLDTIKDFEDDKLGAYRKYISQNKSYWRTVERYTAQLRDSVLQKEIESYFIKEIEAYEADIASLKNTEEEIEGRAQRLKDQEILLKLMVSLSMIKNYQEHKKPDLEPLNEVKNTYDTLINGIGAYTYLNQ